MGDDCEIQAVQSLEDKNRFFFGCEKKINLQMNEIDQLIETKTLKE